MPFKTPEERAIKINFIIDIQRIGKRVQEFLNKEFKNKMKAPLPVFSASSSRYPIGGSFVYGKKLFGCTIHYKIRSAGSNESLYSIDLIRSNSKKAPFEISCVFSKAEGDKLVKDSTYTIPVSSQEVYNKKEIEKAEMSIKARVLEKLEKAPRVSLGNGLLESLKKDQV